VVADILVATITAAKQDEEDPCDPDNPKIRRRPGIPHHCSLTKELLNICGTDGYCYYSMRQLNCAAEVFGSK
jgi:hypothetical protein